MTKKEQKEVDRNIKDRKRKELELLVKEKKAQLIKIIEAASVYEGWQKQISLLSGVRRETIKQLISEGYYVSGTNTSNDLYIEVIPAAKQYLREAKKSADIKFKEQENN